MIWKDFKTADSLSILKIKKHCKILSALKHIVTKYPRNGDFATENDLNHARN